MHSIATHQVKESRKFTVRELLSNENSGKYGYQSKHFDVTIAESKMKVMQNLMPVLSHEHENGKIRLKKNTKRKLTSLQLPVGIVSDLVIHTLQKGSHYHLESSDCPTL